MILRSRDRNDLVVGYFHPGYEEKQLQAMRDRGCDAGCVIKGEEGTSQLSLRSGAPSEGTRKTLNYVQGFRPDGEISHDFDPTEIGFHYDQSPRPEKISAKAFAESGIKALDGSTGHIRDRIIMNVGVLDWLLGYAPNLDNSLNAVRRVIEDGTAKRHLEAYVRTTNEKNA